MEKISQENISKIETISSELANMKNYKETVKALIDEKLESTKVDIDVKIERLSSPLQEVIDNINILTTNQDMELKELKNKYTDLTVAVKAVSEQYIECKKHLDFVLSEQLTTLNQINEMNDSLVSFKKDIQTNSMRIEVAKAESLENTLTKFEEIKMLIKKYEDEVNKVKESSTIHNTLVSTFESQMQEHNKLLTQQNVLFEDKLSLMKTNTVNEVKASFDSFKCEITRLDNEIKTINYDMIATKRDMENNKTFLENRLRTIREQTIDDMSIQYKAFSGDVNRVEEINKAKLLEFTLLKKDFSNLEQSLIHLKNLSNDDIKKSLTSNQLQFSKLELENNKISERLSEIYSSLTLFKAEQEQIYNKMKEDNKFDITVNTENLQNMIRQGQEEFGRQLASITELR